MSDDSRPKLLTVADLASQLQLAERTILRMIHKGEIPCLRIASQWRFVPTQIEQWLHSRAVTGGESGESTGLSTLIENSPESVPLSRLTGEQFIVADLRAGTREEVLEQLVEPMAAAGIVTDSAAYLEKLLAREELMTTAIGNGVAIPHVRNPRENPVKQPVVVIGVCREGTAFASLDGDATRLFFLLAAVNEVVHLGLIARINRFLLRPGVVEGLSLAKSAREVFEILIHEDAIYQTKIREGAAK
ncbi:MAG: PTS transporter subunit EIIA [Spirochaetales bacterium]|jgi:nitrogen PTS system EIIA component|nr:PTS transporter subunit EIIA [Spirochaetales bacterium]